MSFYLTSHNEPSITINFENVPIEKMAADIIPSKLDEIFKKLLVDDSYLDLERLRTFVERNKLHILSYLDNYPHEKLSSIIIEDFLYGNSSVDVSNIICIECKLLINYTKLTIILITIYNIFS